MPQGENTWQWMEDTDFIGSTIPDTALVGFYEFTDGVLLVCLVTEDSSGDSDLNESPSESEEVIGLWEDYDDIPF